MKTAAVSTLVSSNALRSFKCQLSEIQKTSVLIIEAFLRSQNAELRFFFHSRWSKTSPGSWKTMSCCCSAIMTLSSCSRVVSVCVFCAHPAWWMCVPLLVGLAGADWVRDPESRIRCGRAFIVAWRHKTSKSCVGLFKQDTKPDTLKSWTPASVYKALRIHTALSSHCRVDNITSSLWIVQWLSHRRGKLNKGNTDKTLLMNRGGVVYFAGSSREKN